MDFKKHGLEKTLFLEANLTFKKTKPRRCRKCWNRKPLNGLGKKFLRQQFSVIFLFHRDRQMKCPSKVLWFMGQVSSARIWAKSLLRLRARIEGKFILYKDLEAIKGRVRQLQGGR